MKIETIYVLERLNTGNYNHLEMSATAKIEEGEDAFSAMLSLKTLVNAALAGKAASLKVEVPQGIQAKESIVIKEGIKEEEAKKERKTRTTKPKVEEVKSEVVDTLPEGQAIPPVIEEVKEETKEEVKSKPAIKYSRAIEAHKTLLSSTLTSNFPSWKSSKPKDEIIAFTTSLEGKDFLDENGLVVDSFKKVLSGFFA